MSTNESSSFPVVFQGEIGGDLVQTVNARDIHVFLEVKSEFRNWIKNRIDDFGFQQDIDFVAGNFLPGSEKIEYHVTLDMAKELSMVDRGERGKQVRKYFLECERRAKDPMVALNDPAAMRGLLLTYTERVIALEAKVEEAKPKTEFFDKFADTDGGYGLMNAGRIITGRAKKFIRELKKGYVFYQGGNLVPYVQFIKQGLFEVKVTIIDDKARPQTFITPKGMQYFAAKFGGENLL